MSSSTTPERGKEERPNMKNRYTAIFTHSNQVTQYDYELATSTLECNDQTTMGQIREWISAKTNSSKDFLIDIKIVSLDQISNTNE